MLFPVVELVSNQFTLCEKEDNLFGLCAKQ